MKNYKTVLYSAVIYSVIIGAIIVGLSVVGLLTRWCVIDMDGSPLIYMMFLLFFRVEACEKELRWDVLNIESVQPVSLPEESEAVQRTFIFLLVYLGLHGALILTALYGLCGVNNSCLGRKSFPVFIAPWVIVWIAIIVLDVLASVYYIIDIIETTTVDGTMNLMGIINVNEVRPLFEQIASHYRYLPPIFMLLATSKVFVFVIVNIVWVVLITKAGWTASTYHKYIDQTRRNYENTMASVNPAFEELRNDVAAQKQHERQMNFMSEQPTQEVSASAANPSAAPAESAETRYDDTTRQQAFVLPFQVTAAKQEEQVQKQPPPSKYRSQRPNSLAIQERPQSQQPQPFYRDDLDYEVDHRLSRFQEVTGSSVKTVEPLNDIPEQQQLNTRVRVLPPVVYANKPLNETRPQMGRSHSEMKQKPIPPPKPTSMRYSMQPPADQSPVLYRPNRPGSSSQKVERTSSSVRAPDELRSQLPWSYFKPREDTPRRAFNDLKEDEETPTVPVPDYTLHYGKRERTKLSESDGEGSWSYQRY